jgi:hypothetical protein
MTLIDQIRDMIAEGQTERSLEELYKYVKENNAELIDRLVMLRNQLNSIQDQEIRGTIDNQAANLERAKVNDSILKLLPQLTPEYMAQAAAWKAASQSQPQSAPMSMGSSAAPALSKMKWMLIGGGGLLAIIILIIALSGGGEEPVYEEEFGAELQEDAAPSATLLEWVVEAHNGYAVWVAEPNAQGQTTYFMLNENGNFQEFHDDQVFAEFQIQDETTDFVELYDPVRQLSLRIYETEAFFLNPNDSQWNKLATGEWVTPE